MVNKLLADLRSTSKTNEKIRILENFKDKNLLKKILSYTYDDVTYSFGIKKIPESNSYDLFSLEGQEMSLEELISLLDRLVDRTYTGNDAVEYLSFVLSSAKISGYYDVIKCIIERDLSAGVNEGIIEKVFPGTIKKPKVMLISSFDNDKILKKIRFPAIAQMKVDGARAILIKEGSDIKILTRAGNEYTGLDHIKNALKSIEGNFVLDGEIIYNSNEKNTVEDRQTSNGIVNKSIQGTISLEESKNLQYIVWDYIDLEEYKTESKKSLYFERLNKLKSIVNDKSIFLVESFEVNSLNEAKELYKKYREQDYEGIILKNKHLKWENKRSQDAFKFKDEFDIDLRIVNWEYHSKDNNKLGAILCESDDNKISVSVGSGFKDMKNVHDIQDRSGALISALKGDLVGKIVTIRCNAIIKSKDKEIHSLFLPRLICFRHDKTDTNNLDEFM